MQVPLEISYRGIEKTDDIDTLVRQKVAKLEQVCDFLISCHVAIEKPQKHQRQGSPYRIRISMRVPPEHELIVKQEPGEGDMHDPLSTVIRRCFQSARRELKKIVDLQRGEIKKHPQQEVGALVSQIFPEKGYGFLKTIDDREVYFHKNSVLHGDFDRLEVGTGVRYVEKEGEKGPQASTVQIVDKPGARRSKTKEEDIL